MGGIHQGGIERRGIHQGEFDWGELVWGGEGGIFQRGILLAVKKGNI